MGQAVVESEVGIETADGTMGTFVVHPEPADDGAPHPAVLFLMDAPGKRPLLHSMARRLAGEGYYVLLPNLYYRATDHFELDFDDPASLERMTELMYALGNRMVAGDAATLIGHAESDPAADTSRIGCVGYCMSGPFALWSAAELDLAAAASFYGVRLHVDRPDSPHLRLGEITGEIYVACAEHDDWVPLDMVDRFEEAMRESGVRGRLERYWGLHHGFAFDDRPAYDADGDRRHWEALFDLFGRNLRAGS